MHRQQIHHHLLLRSCSKPDIYQYNRQGFPEELIAKETDCRTYKLGNVSKSYRVKKVEVKKKAKHVKITYRNKKKKDKILFEYKEEENAPDVINQFTEKNELKKEKVDDSEVTMYGDEKCDAMTWQKESCTFAVKMSTACSTDKAKKIN